MLRPCGVITLLTDFGLKDPFVGIMKGVIYNINPQAKIVDLSHEVESFNIREAAFKLLASYKYFPKGTIHVVVVDPGVGGKRKAIVIETKNYFFVGPDNGVLIPAAKDDGIVRIIELTNQKFFLKPLSYTFHGRDIFAPCAAYISVGVDPLQLGKIIDVDKIVDLDLRIIRDFRNYIEAEVIHIDNFGNIMLNVNGFVFKEKVNYGKRINLTFHDKTMEVKFVRTFSDVKPGKPCLYINSFGLLELGINRGNAKRTFNLKMGDKICLKLS